MKQVCQNRSALFFLSLVTLLVGMRVVGDELRRITDFIETAVYSVAHLLDLLYPHSL